MKRDYLIVIVGVFVLLVVGAELDDYNARQLAAADQREADAKVERADAAYADLNAKAKALTAYDQIK